MINSNRLLVLVFISAFAFSSCKDMTSISEMKVEETNANLHESNLGKSNEVVNEWIYEVMNIFYLWGPNMPTKAASNMALEPDKYFNESLLYKPGEVDRFSWIAEDAVALTASLGGVSTPAGFSYTPFLISNTSDDIVFSVRFSIKSSPAEKAGLKRGDIITKVNGTTINKTNYQSILAGENIVLTLADVTSGNIVSGDKTISIVKESIQNYPVHYSTVLELGGKKIGYLVYNQFINGIGTNSQFNNELRALFGDFKAKGVNELVLDLRYNGGGYTSASDILSSLIVKDLKPGTLLNKQIWSDNGIRYAKTNWGYSDSDFEVKWLNEANNIGANLSRVYVLTSSGTASASELVINNLKPYMEVILVGGNTYGKDVGSITLSDEANNYRWKWGLQPIVLRTVNSLGEANYGTVDGFTPNIKIAENVLPFRAFGDPQETYLNAALENMLGGTLATKGARQGSVLMGLEGAGGYDNPVNNIKDMFVESKK